MQYGFLIWIKFQRKKSNHNILVEFQLNPWREVVTQIDDFAKKTCEIPIYCFIDDGLQYKNADKNYSLQSCCCIVTKFFIHCEVITCVWSFFRVSKYDSIQNVLWLQPSLSTNRRTSLSQISAAKVNADNGNKIVLHAFESPPIGVFFTHFRTVLFALLNRSVQIYWVEKKNLRQRRKTREPFLSRVEEIV